MYKKELEAAIQAARNAIPGIMKIYNTPFDVEIKEDLKYIWDETNGINETEREYAINRIQTRSMTTDNLSHSAILLMVSSARLCHQVP